MAFDLSTARPVEQPSVGGFDLSTAKPVATTEDDQEDSFLEATGQTLDVLGRGAVGEIGGGLSGLVELAMTQDPAKAAAAVNEFRQSVSAVPGERSQEQLQSLGGVVENIAQAANIPLSGVAGATQLLEGEGLEQAVQSIRDVQDKGFIRASGEKTLEETDSPALAAATEAGLSAVPDILALKGAGKVAGASEKVVDIAVKSTSEAAEEAFKTVLNKPEVRVFDEEGLFTEDAINILREARDNNQPVDSVPSSQESAIFTDDVIQAIESRPVDSVEIVNKQISSQLDSGNILSAEDAERFNLFRKRGIQPTKAQITQKGSEFIEQQELSKKSNEVSELLATQDARLAEIAREGADNIGSVARDVEETNNFAFNVIDGIVSAAEQDVTRAYDAARKFAPDAKNVKLDDLVALVRKNSGKNDLTGGLIKSIRQDLKNAGVVDKGFKRTGRIDVNTAEEIRKALNRSFDSVTPEGRRLIHEFKNALDDDVAKVVPNDIFNNARASKIELQRIIEKQSRDKRDKTKGSLLEDILYNKVPSEKIVQKLRTARDDDFLKMKEFFTRDSGDNGIQAWNNIKAQILNDAIDSAVSTAGKGEGGVSVFNANKFKQNLASLRKSSKFRELFNDDEIELIDDIIEIGRLRTPTSGSFAGQGPSAVAINSAKNEVLRSIPFLDKAKGLIDALQTRSQVKTQLDPSAKTGKILEKEL